ncbi:MAG: hypothetical protein AAB676_18815 [Verrucomicrobiota bacterium]
MNRSKYDVARPNPQCKDGHHHRHTYATMALESSLRKKVFVADNCALLANYAFDPTTALNGCWALLGVLASLLGMAARRHPKSKGRQRCRR